jgi:hypothetical protein
LFRVVGATGYLDHQAGSRWLADGSGVAVSGPGHQPRFAMRDGSFREFSGMPSPDSPEVFAVVCGPPDCGIGLVDAQGTSLFNLTFQGGVRDLVDAWGERGDELRVLTPHGGHGGPGLEISLVEPYVEQPPFDGQSALQLSALAVAYGLVNLYAEPGGAAVGVVASPYRVTVHEVLMRCTGDFERYGDVQDCPPLDTPAHRDFVALLTGTPVGEGTLLAGQWARVTTSDGREGWMLLQVNGVGI